MDVVCIVGVVPGFITATVSHAADIRQLAMEIARHPAGGWQARTRHGVWGLRCHSVNTAVLLEAAEAFTESGMLLAAE